MKRMAWVLAGVWLFICSASALGDEMGWENIGRENQDIKAVLVSPRDTRQIYFGSTKGAFLSMDGGKTWRNVLLTRGQNKAVNFLAFDHFNENIVYAATGNGLFCSIAKGKDWRRIFKGKGSLENNCTNVAVFRTNIYLGTKSGLFISQDSGRSWHRAGGKLGRAYILAIAAMDQNQNIIYAASQEGVFKSMDKGSSWERVFVGEPAEKDDFEDEVTSDQDEEMNVASIRYIALDNRKKILYLATSKGVYQSLDQAKTWEVLSESGLLSREVKFLCVSGGSVLYALIKNGVFEYRNERWHERSWGMSGGYFNALCLDSRGVIYVACERGLFKTVSVKFDQRIAVAHSQDEPGIREVQNAAIHYAEVEPEKIKNWRKLAAKKAIMPKISANVSRDTGDLWHWESGSSTRINDDVLVRGRDALGWYVTLSWDLSELIWTNDQTTIDVRSKLMVQLRDDILDEVTKLYFERLRVKMEMDNLSIEDIKKRREKELRLEELAASIDALTGGYFSAHLKKPVP